MSATPFGWAIAGTGRIAYRFAGDMRLARRGRVVAVASASPERGRALAAAIGPRVASGDLDAVLRDPAVEGVYVAGRNEDHCAQALRCLAAGKPVLVEKPFALSAGEATRIREEAASAGLLAMEATWMRFTPGIRRLNALIDAGAIGRLHAMEASLAFANPSPPASALLDLGVYPVSLAVRFFGTPARIAVAATSDERQVALTLAYPDALAAFTVGFAAAGPNTLTITGETGVLSTNAPFFCPSLLTRRRTTATPAPGTDDGPALPRSPRFGSARSLLRGLRNDRYPTLFEGTGLQYQADHFVECVRKDLIDSPVMPLRDSIEVLRVVGEAEAMLASQKPPSAVAGSKVETGR